MLNVSVAVTSSIIQLARWIVLFSLSEMSTSSFHIPEGDKIVKWNQFQSNLFASASINKLDVFDTIESVENENHFKISKLWTPSKEIASISCFEWSQSYLRPYFILFGCANGTVKLIDPNQKEEVTQLLHRYFLYGIILSFSKLLTIWLSISDLVRRSHGIH